MAEKRQNPAASSVHGLTCAHLVLFGEDTNSLPKTLPLRSFLALSKVKAIVLKNFLFLNHKLKSAFSQLLIFLKSHKNIIL